MAYRIAPLSTTLSDLQGHSLTARLLAFTKAIFLTVVQQLRRLQLT